MSGLPYIAISLAIGAAFAGVILIARRNDTRLTQWQRGLIGVAALLFGFELGTLVTRAAVGPGAVPAWSAATMHLWMPALGLIFAAGLNPRRAPERQDSMRVIGYLLFALGIFAVGSDLYPFLARN